MREVGRVIDGSQHGGPVHGHPLHLLVVIKEADDVVLATAADHRQDFARQAAGGYQDQLTHVRIPTAAARMVLMIRLSPSSSSSWNTGRIRVLSLSRSVCSSR